MKKILIGLVIAMAGAGLTTTANAASTACGSVCVTLTPQAFGTGTVISVPPTGQIHAGEQLVTRQAGPSTLEDFLPENYGTALAVYFSRGLVTAAIASTWPKDPVIQLVFAPGGKSTNLCLGVATTTTENGTAVTLQPCDTPLRTMWVVMLTSSGTYIPMISGTDTSTTDPQVLTANEAAGPLDVNELDTFFANSVPSPIQMWSSIYGPIRSYAILRQPPWLHSPA
jgi:hypothetical protein